MGEYVVFHDKRLGGSPPQRRTITNIALDATTSLFGSFPIVRALAQLDGRQGLYMLCHAYAGINTSQQVCGDMGRMGLHLGREGVLHSNVARWAELRGSVTVAVVQARPSPDGYSASAPIRYRPSAAVPRSPRCVSAAPQEYTTMNCRPR